jgi:hypothetical protein
MVASHQLLFAWFLTVSFAACGPAAPPAAAPEPTPADDAPVNKLGGMKVYDADGHELACEPPASECPAPVANGEFQKQCALAGFRMQRCGCASLCTGKPDRPLYDAQGNAKPCAPAKDDCQPPQVSAAFQDACIEHGFKLQACGCDEWLCTGNSAR